VRRRARLDTHQRAVVEALRACGCSVYSLAECGDGVPDLLVGVRGQTWLIEVKSDKNTHRRATELTPAQESWHARWRGAKVVIVHAPAEALAALGLA